MTGVAGYAVVFIQEFTVIVAVYRLLNVHVGEADIVGGVVFIVPGTLKKIKSLDIRPVSSVIVDYHVVVKLQNIACLHVVRTPGHAVVIPDRDIVEGAVTAVGDHDSPVTHVTGYAVVFIQELAVVVAVYRFLDLDAGADDPRVLGDKPVDIVTGAVISSRLKLILDPIPTKYRDPHNVGLIRDISSVEIRDIARRLHNRRVYTLFNEVNNRTVRQRIPNFDYGVGGRISGRVLDRHLVVYGVTDIVDIGRKWVRHVLGDGNLRRQHRYRHPKQGNDHGQYHQYWQKHTYSSFQFAPPFHCFLCCYCFCCPML